MRTIKFKAKRVDNGEWIVGDLNHVEGCCYIFNEDQLDSPDNYEVHPETVCQFTGLTDKNGNEIYQSDIICVKTPARETQTHRGDNIPLGEYIEPLEPRIDIEQFVVSFKDAAFVGVNAKGEIINLAYFPITLDLDSAKDMFLMGWGVYDNSKFQWGGNDGDMQYLLEEYGKETEKELIEWLGTEVIGNIHD